MIISKYLKNVAIYSKFEKPGVREALLPLASVAASEEAERIAEHIVSRNLPSKKKRKITRVLHVTQALQICSIT